MFKKQPPIFISTRALSASSLETKVVDGTEDASRYSACSSPRIESPHDASLCSIRTQSSTTFGDNDHPPEKLSTFRLLVAHIGAAMALFLATTDATIVSTSLPTIASELNASQIQYTWVGVAYMLTQTAFQPLYGRISDLVGRKNVLYSSMSIFAIGSLLCGVARSIEWLIAARALAGIGGGGIVSSIWVITAEIVDVQHRAKWSQALSITWSCSAVAGPLLGGVFSGVHQSSPLSWRWGFYINLPICFIALIVLSTSLRGITFIRSSGASWHTLAQKFDFGGLFLFMGGTSCIIIGFSFATEIGWSTPSTLILIVSGLAVLICGGFYEKYTTRDCLFPATTFTDLTTITILIITFLHNFAFNAGTFYLALFYQAANGSTPLWAGIKLLPYSLGSSLASMPAAWFIGYRQKRSHDTSAQNSIVSVGLLLSTAGFGLLYVLDERSSVLTQVLHPLIAGIGLGMLFHAPYQIFVNALKPHELATGTSAFFLVRFTGATVGLAVAGAIFCAQASASLPPGLLSPGSGSSVDYTGLASLQPSGLRSEVLHVVSSSIQTIWAVCAPCLGVAFLISFLLRRVTIDEPKNVMQTGSIIESSVAEKV